MAKAKADSDVVVADCRASMRKRGKSPAPWKQSQSYRVPVMCDTERKARHSSVTIRGVVYLEHFDERCAMLRADCLMKRMPCT